MECNTFATFLQCNPHLVIALSIYDIKWLEVRLIWPEEELCVKVNVPLEPMKNFEDICLLVLNDLKAQIDEKFREVKNVR